MPLFFSNFDQNIKSVTPISMNIPTDILAIILAYLGPIEALKAKWTTKSFTIAFNKYISGATIRPTSLNKARLFKKAHCLDLSAINMPNMAQEGEMVNLLFNYGKDLIPIVNDHQCHTIILPYGTYVYSDLAMALQGVRCLHCHYISVKSARIFNNSAKLKKLVVVKATFNELQFLSCLEELVIEEIDIHFCLYLYNMDIQGRFKRLTINNMNNMEPQSQNRMAISNMAMCHLEYFQCPDRILTANIMEIIAKRAT
jgi:hypothetical protein